ncbi:unnamed protein product [Mucor hiemalis]
MSSTPQPTNRPPQKQVDELDHPQRKMIRYPRPKKERRRITVKTKLKKLAKYYFTDHLTVKEASKKCNMNLSSAYRYVRKMKDLKLQYVFYDGKGRIDAQKRQKRQINLLLSALKTYLLIRFDLDKYSFETAMQIDNDAFYSLNQEEEELLEENVDNAVNDESNAPEPVKQRAFHNKEKQQKLWKDT